MSTTDGPGGDPGSDTITNLADAAALAQSALGGLTSTLLGLAPLAEVAYTFTSAGDPDTRWNVVRLHLREALGEPYEARLDLACDDLSANPDALLGAASRLVL